MFSTLKQYGIPLAAAVLLSACSSGETLDVSDATGGTPVPTPTPGDTVSFQNNVLPAFSASCTNGCHAADGTGGGLTLAGDAALVHNELTTGGLSGQSSLNVADPAQSLVLTKPDAGSTAVPHSGGKPWDSSNGNYQVVLTWIQQGALNN